MSKDLTQKLNDSLEEKVDWLISAVRSIDTRVQSIDTRVQSIDSRLGNLETKVDERLKDTRPIWEAVQAQLAELKQTQAELKESQDGTRLDVQNFRAETEKAFRVFDRQLEHYPRTVGEVKRLPARS